jgi:signal transduction histidine kinase
MTSMTERILLVDDEPHLRLALTDLLEMSGYDVVAVGDGETAVQALETGTFDVIIADVMMPRVDGWDLVRQVRANARFHDVVFIFLTARGRRDDEIQGRELGADDYLGKPFEPEDLLTRIRTRLRRRAEILARYRDEISRLQELNRIKDEFVALTTHELARPLSAIRGFADLLISRSADDSTQRSFLELIRSESQGMAGLADDLLMLASLDRGRSLECESTDVAELLQEVLQPFHRPPMTHRFQLLAAEGLPSIRVDISLMKRAFTNLISNAAKYAPTRSPIRIHAHRQGDGLIVDIADEGMGIAPDQLENLGKPFFRVKSEATRGIAGTGLGLALVYRILAAHGGRMEVHSTLGEGTTFSVRLPLPPDSGC